MESFTPFLPLLIIIVVIVVIVRWRRSVRYLKDGGTKNLKDHGIEPVEKSKESIPVELDYLSDKKTWFGSKEKTMASLVKCTECGHPISKQARTCPNCGHLKKRFLDGCGVLLVIIILVIILIWFFGWMVI